MSRFPDTEQASLRLALNGKGLTRTDLLKYSPDKLPSNKRLAEETVSVIRLHANERRPQDFLLPLLLFLYFSFNIPSILLYRSSHCSIRLPARFSCLIYMWFAFECTPREADRSSGLLRAKVISRRCTFAYKPIYISLKFSSQDHRLYHSKLRNYLQSRN